MSLVSGNVRQVKATSLTANLIPTLPPALKLAPPIPNAQACRRALADCTGWDGAITSGAVSSPLVSAAVHAKRHGEAMRSKEGRSTAPSPHFSWKEGNSPLPVSHPSGAKRREALPLALTIDLHPHPCPRVQVLRASRILPRHGLYPRENHATNWTTCSSDTLAA